MRTQCERKETSMATRFHSCRWCKRNTHCPRRWAGPRTHTQCALAESKRDKPPEREGCPQVHPQCTHLPAADSARPPAIEHQEKERVREAQVEVRAAPGTRRPASTKKRVSPRGTFRKRAVRKTKGTVSKALGRRPAIADRKWTLRPPGERQTQSQRASKESVPPAVQAQAFVVEERETRVKSIGGRVPASAHATSTQIQ